MVKDAENITYMTDMESLESEAGRRFLKQKYGARIDFLERYFGDRFADIRLFDVGIGYGMFLKELEERGVERLHGMDPFPRSIEIARRNTSAILYAGNILDDDWPVEKKFFDAVTCLDVLEHLERPDVFLVKVREYLREGGIVIVTTPNKGIPYMMRSIPLIGFKDRNPTHINVRRPRYWRKLAVENGLEVIAEWKGEYLTHIRFIPKVLTLLCRLLRLDHRRIPLVNEFEQSFCMVLRPVERG